jgi:hypothetical protein
MHRLILLLYKESDYVKIIYIRVFSKIGMNNYIR